MVSEKIFLSFSHYKPMRANEPQGVANLHPRGMVGRTYVSDHLMLLHTKYLSSGLHGFQGRIFFTFYPLWELYVAMETRIPIRPKTLGSLSPYLIMLHLKFDQDWPSGIRDILI